MVYILQNYLLYFVPACITFIHKREFPFQWLAPFMIPQWEFREARVKWDKRVFPVLILFYSFYLV